MVIIWSSLPHGAQASWLLSLSSFKAGLCFLPLPWLSPTSPLQDSLGTWPQVEKAVGGMYPGPQSCLEGSRHSGLQTYFPNLHNGHHHPFWRSGYEDKRRAWVRRCSLWYPARQDMGNDLSLKMEATDPGTNPGSILDRVAGKPGRLGGEGGDLGQGGDSTGSQGLTLQGALQIPSVQCVLWIPPRASSFELTNLECAIPPPSQAFAHAVPPPLGPSLLLCPTRSVLPPVGITPPPPPSPGQRRVRGDSPPLLQPIGSLSLWGTLCGSRPWL